METVKLKELVDIYLGVTHTPEYVFEGVPFLSVKDISEGEISFSDCKYISQEEYNSLSEGAKPKVGDNLTIEIDYDKMAKVIVNAEREVNTDNSTLSKILSVLSAL